MSDKTANGSANGRVSDSKAAGNRHPDAASLSDVAAAAATPQVAQGLQSVMAVIGENYDPAVRGAVDQVDLSGNKINAAQASKLTDKIDAARNKQSEGSSVKQGLQSIMAVIGEEYEDEPGEAAQVITPPAPVKKTTEAAPQDRQNVEATSAISDLLPMLTNDEQDMAQTHHQVVENDQALSLSQPVVAAAPAVFRGPESTISDLLNQLKSDISTLERGNTSSRDRFNMPAAIDNASTEMQSLLAELQGDISALRNENDTLKTHYNVPTATALAGQGTEVTMLLNQLQGDIAGLRSENDSLKSRAPGGSGEISGLLAQLQGDISGLRSENDSYKAFYKAVDTRSGASFGQTFLMTVGLFALVGGATLGGMYYANSQNNRNNENMLALLGIKGGQTAKTVPNTAVQPVVRKAVIVAPAEVVAPRVAAIAPPPALPKLTVKRPSLDSAEVTALLLDAKNLIDLGDLVSARQMLEYAMSQKSAEAAYKLAQTYDPLHLATMASVLSVEPNITRAKVLYYSAARQGHQAASKRLSELRRTR